MEEIDNEETPIQDQDNDQLAQLSPADSLIDRGVADPLDEGYIAPDHWSPAQGFGNTPAEMERGETIEQRLPQEEPEAASDAPERDWNPHRENREVGSRRAGRLVASGVGAGGEDHESQSLAHDVGISGGAASAEEAAMHIIEEDSDEDSEAATPMRKAAPED
ncbi:hypothetical protein SAMN05443377_102167 [Propionibacterium cyclohexanicum]|uniref:DUF5709 domain-containing protein n=1 Tax=Propionibacterium cyclohexanicum TaxID=64702 RepID=A0A1H9Q8K6_9ACTN|nr:DUF5709 domain-containing protein [Propionibacterium cyclohexanicum]SER56229.1 hypothetical protein SAMN05443377_102167 [Propionibacterium cyclohexanicum]